MTTARAGQPKKYTEGNFGGKGSEAQERNRRHRRASYKARGPLTADKIINIVALRSCLDP